MKVIIVGGGRPLHFLAMNFLGKGYDVTLIDKDQHECAMLARRSEAMVVHGDGSDPLVLEDAGARKADVVLASTQSDPDNLVICQIAQTHFGVPRTVALVNDPDNREIFRQFGISAISTSMTIASLIEQGATLEQVTNLIPAGEGKVLISEVSLTGASPLAGRRLAEVPFPKDALVGMVMRDGVTLIPKGDTKLEAGDRVLLICLASAQAKAVAFITGQAS